MEEQKKENKFKSFVQRNKIFILCGLIVALLFLLIMEKINVIHLTDKYILLLDTFANYTDKCILIK